MTYLIIWGVGITIVLVMLVCFAVCKAAGMADEDAERMLHFLDQDRLR
jgi:hypothetical protein